MSYRCVPTCKTAARAYAQQGDLRRHQTSCTAFQTADIARRQAVVDPVAAFQQRKRKQREEQRAATTENAAGTSQQTNLDSTQFSLHNDLTAPFRDPTPPPPDPTPTPLNAAGRPIRKKRKTWKLLQQKPDAPLSLPVPLPSEEPSLPPPPPPPQSTYQWAWQGLRTTINTFGLYREYPSLPTYNPDEQLGDEDLSDIANPQRSNTANFAPTETPFKSADELSGPSPSDSATPSLWTRITQSGPFQNVSRAGLMSYMWGGSAQKSVDDFQNLVNFLGSEDFKPADVAGMNVKQETAKLDAYLASADNGIRDGWKHTTIKISVPDGKPHASEADAPIFTMPGLYYRPLVETIKAAIVNGGARCFHYTPFKQFWVASPGAKPQRVHDEIYSSDAMVEAYKELHSKPPAPGCSLERVILPLMFWSDSTHLASFGSASLWPLYLFFGNQSKWLRAKPRAGVCHHVAYFPKLPDSFHDWFKGLTGDGPSGDLLTHCRRELMHQIWRLLLDDEFLEAWEHGIVIKCEDGIERRFFPRLFTYSADYPEKVLLATVRNMGKCPCPRCFLPKEQIPDIGMELDKKRREKLARTDNDHRRSRIATVRKWIYEWGYKIKSAAVERFLSPFSEVPTSNAFSDRLSRFNFDPFKMLVPDFMHEFELGVFKAFFTHLLRVFQAYGEGCVSELDYRFRLVPTFGQATIRRFSENTSALKKLAAWNWQAILICSLPVVENLLSDPNENNELLDIIFTLAEWHAFAKLRIHTDDTIDHLRFVTKELGRLLRRFQRVFLEKLAVRGIIPKELPSEHNARGRRSAKRAAKANATKAAKRAKSRQTTSGDDESPKEKLYSMLTYKLHALGDYIISILWFGTLDSYSTQTGELEHRRVKRFYARTNKNRAVRQMTLLERRDTYFRNIHARSARSATAAVRPTTATPVRQIHRSNKTVPFADQEALPYMAPGQHYHVADSQNTKIHVARWLFDNRQDPAVTGFWSKLQGHLLSRLIDPDHTGDNDEFTQDELDDVILRGDNIYYHQMCRINYTTYDVRRGQDTINPKRRSDVMMLSPENDTTHPFSYAQVLMVCHANVVRKSDPTAAPQRIDFLWVRRYAFDATYKSGFKRKRLHRLQFLPETDANAFAFINPDEVIRASHLIPAFAHKTRNDLLANDSVGRLPREGLRSDEDWAYYYVNFFADRDMVMRYFGGGVGHYRVPLPADPEPSPEQLPQPDDVELPDNTPIVVPQAPDLPQQPPSAPADRAEVSPDVNDDAGISGSDDGGKRLGGVVI
ncbi:hypothetical protein C8F01DRAFT_1375308 [Mycena amicta]|nr:hypothetical protein C8F01DRAFT_1375308 [Mycena amicta]